MDTVTLDATVVSMFLLVLARTGGWVITTPLFGARTTTLTGRIALSVGLALVLTLPASATGAVPSTLGGFIVAVIVQFLFGAAFGFLSGLFLYAAGIAGSIADLLSGLGYAAVVDPASGQQAAVFSRFFSLTFMALLLVTNGYMTVIEGLGLTFQVVPVGASVPFNPDGVFALAEGITLLLRAAVEVGAPLLGVLLLTEVALAIGARFFPQANVTFLGLSLKALVALSAAGAVLLLLPARIDTLLAGGDALARAVFG